jgi:hypothetical protein
LAKRELSAQADLVARLLFSTPSLERYCTFDLYRSRVGGNDRPGGNAANMTHSTKLLLALLVLGAAAAFWWKFRPVSYRYTLTVTVETPNGIRTGSAVQEISGRDVLLKLADGHAAIVKLRGEAVPVRLPGDRYLFALLSSEGEESIIPAVQSAFDPEYERGGEGNLATVRKMARSPDRAVHELQRVNAFERGKRPFLPRIVTFRDMRDPGSIVEVAPGDLARQFGPGTVLTSVTVAKTSAPLTQSLFAVLPWLRSKPATLEAGWKGGTNPTLAQKMSYRDFKRD